MKIILVLHFQQAGMHFHPGLLVDGALVAGLLSIPREADLIK